MSQISLIAGQQYDLDALILIDWTDGDGSGAEGYRLIDYFEADGTYIGADQHGIEPIVVRR